MYCVKCGKFLDNDDRFCPACGKSNPDYLFCMKCGKPLDSKTRFCSGCGSQNPNFDYDPYTPGINPPPAGYNGEAGFNGGQNYDPNPMNNQSFARNTAQGVTPQSYGQTISPYADDPVPNAQAKAAQNSVPPVYTAENANAVGFVNPGTPAPDNNGSINNTNINGIKNKKKTGHIVAAGIGVIFAVVTGIIMASNAIAGQLGLDHDPSPRDLNNKGDYVPTEYTFNPMNNLKEPGVIWETDNVKISTMNIIHDSSFSSSAKLQLQIENKTAQDIRIGADNILINGYDTNDYLSQSVSAGSTATGDVYIDLDTLEKLNIENINTIDIWFEVEDKSWDTIETSDKITIETRNTADNEPYVPDVILYEEDGIVIGYHGMEYYDRYSNDINFEFYYENNTDIPICFKTSSFGINGESVKGYDDRPILYPGTGGIFKTRVKEEELKKIKADYIEDIDKIVISVDGTEENNFTEHVFTTDPLVVTTH